MMKEVFQRGYMIIIYNGIKAIEHGSMALELHMHRSKTSRTIQGKNKTKQNERRQAWKGGMVTTHVLMSV